MSDRKSVLSPMDLFMQHYVNCRCEMVTLTDTNAVGTVIGVLHATVPWALQISLAAVFWTS